ncbi:MAG: hypothetical protein ABS82_08405 [Rhodanobacter sp. SCN 67-45]|nr:MAG: hypothetical protein ABS82_08405 [Rhodanobacter sp. SCN 67-45]
MRSFSPAWMRKFASITITPSRSNTRVAPRTAPAPQPMCSSHGTGENTPRLSRLQPSVLPSSDCSSGWLQSTLLPDGGLA